MRVAPSCSYAVQAARRWQVYGEASVGSEVGLHEHSTLEPTNPYSAAKAGAEMMVRQFTAPPSACSRSVQSGPPHVTRCQPTVLPLTCLS